MSKSRPRPTDDELAILSILWESEDLTTATLLARLAAAEPPVALSSTELESTLQRMRSKHFVKRRKVGGVEVYRAVLDEFANARHFVRDLIHRVFRGSSLGVVINALEVAEIDAEDLALVRAAVDEAQKRVAKRQHKSKGPNQRGDGEPPADHD